MFDILVESSKQKQGRRARRLFLATGAIYVVALTALGVATIIGLSPALAEEYYMLSGLVPPPPPQGSTQTALTHSKPDSATRSNLAPPNTIVDNPPPALLRPLADPVMSPAVVGPGWPGDDLKNGVPGIPRSGDTTAPPPPPPVVKPTPTPTPAQVVRLTSVLTQGRVLRRVQPPYPAIARQARVQGQVQVQIGISETGAVTDVTLLSGHPLLRDAALQAAKQWAFIPTELNGQRVRAIGLLTFNFKLD
ncbi:MAG TPA: energy transducer TonB [Blastocatellia bacterium]|nr:energy transducer TonB [Blastocatellia bacterium]